MFMPQVKIQFRLKNFNLNIILSFNIYPHLPPLPPPPKNGYPLSQIFPEYCSHPKRNWRQWWCKIIGDGVARCIMGNLKIVNKWFTCQALYFYSTPYSILICASTFLHVFKVSITFSLCLLLNVLHVGSTDWTKEGITMSRENNEDSNSVRRW